MEKEGANTQKISTHLESKEQRERRGGRGLTEPMFRVPKMSLGVSLPHFHRNFFARCYASALAWHLSTLVRHFPWGGAWCGGGGELRAKQHRELTWQDRGGNA